jgi:hypothetical protein
MSIVVRIGLHRPKSLILDVSTRSREGRIQEGRAPGRGRTDEEQRQLGDGDE